jgi:pimeloyl-ACP methyl ester carboxylesterase
MELRTGTINYVSTVDGTQPLLADVAFIPDGRPKPLLVVMHGYSGERTDVAQDLQELAPRGVFALAPDMRGRGGSGGRWDSGGLDVHDIVDAVLATRALHPDEIDPHNLNIVGYSGGGGNAMACMVRFPDFFQTAVSFFGISDYAGWYHSGGRPDCNRRMEAALGGSPVQLPHLFEARNAIPAAGNACCGKLHFFWDEEETMCPPAQVEAWLAEYHRAGLTQAVVHVSRRGDEQRWIHGYRTGNPCLRAADDLFLPDVLTARTASPALPPRGRLVVPGYLVTHQFRVWIEDGQRGRVTVDYDLTEPAPVLRVVDNPRGYKVRLRADRMGV